jgi:hypothetical protein
LDFADFEDTLDLDANLTLNQTTYTWTQNFTGTTTTGLTYNANSLTSGKALYVASSATAFTGTLIDINLTSSNANNTGTLLKVTSAATNNVTPLMVTNLGAGSSFRVNDETGDADTSPFLIDASGNVGIGITAPGAKLDVVGNILVNNGGSIDARAAGTLTIGGTTQTGLTVGRSGATTTINGSNVIINSLSGIIKGSSGTLSAITSTANYVTYWSDANTNFW